MSPTTDLLNMLMAGSAITAGVLQLFKQTFPDRFLKYVPLVSLPLGIIIGVAGFHLPWLYGLMIGLSSQGLYKVVQVGSDMSLPPTDSKSVVVLPSDAKVSDVMKKESEILPDYPSTSYSEEPPLSPPTN